MRAVTYRAEFDTDPKRSSATCPRLTRLWLTQRTPPLAEASGAGRGGLCLIQAWYVIQRVIRELKTILWLADVPDDCACVAGRPAMVGRQPGS